MVAFQPKPTFNRWNTQQQIGIGLDTPFTFGHAVSENFQQGILDSFGLGTLVRDLSTGGQLSPALSSAPLIGPALTGIYAARDLLLAPDRSGPLTKEAYEASASYRTDVPWDPGMTEDRAASLAAMYDKKTVRAKFSEKQPIGAFLGQLGGQALDPINYVPVFGEAVQAAAVAKMGSIGGRLLMGASEAAVNTAAFGVLTAGTRAKFGDDVSWEGITSEIAMSALIGGAFGGGMGFLFRGADARADAVQRVQPRLETIRNLQESRAVLNDAVGSLLDTGEVKLNANSIAATERIAAEVTQRTDGLRSLRDQTSGVAGSKPGEVVITPNGTRVSVRPEVVEASSLIRASGDLQVRNRGTAASAAQVHDIAANLDPARLMPNVAADQGAPIVGPDNIVDSGNGRVMAIRQAYQAYPEKAAAYRQALADAGYNVDGLQHPVLISRRITDLTHEARAQFNAEANTPSTARMSAVELAAMDRGALTDSVLDVLADAPVTAGGNRAFVQRFLANIPQNDRGALLASDGVQLSSDGVRRIENALVASAYGDVDAGVLRKFSEATDDNTRSIVGAMSDVAGNWVRMRRAVKAGDVDPEFDTTPELTQALRLLSRWRDRAGTEGRAVSTVIREGLAQIDLLDGSISPEAQIFIRMFYANDHFGRAVGRETLAARLNRVVESTLELGRPSLFGDELPVAKGEMLENANRIEANLFAPEGAERSAQEVSGGGEGPSPAGVGGEDRQGYGEGAIAGQVTQRFDVGSPPVDATAPPPDPPPVGLDLATARVGRPESLKELAETFGVDEAGTYPEMSDIDQMRTEGRLTQEDEAELAAADQAFEDAKAWSDTMQVAMRCVIS